MFRRIGINIGFRLINSLLVAKINHPEFKKFVKSLVEPARDIADVLTDNNPNDDDQVREIWYRENDALVDSAFKPIDSLIIEKIKDDGTREHLLAVSKELHTALAEEVKGPNK